VNDAKKQLATLVNGAALGVVTDTDGAPVVRIEEDLNVTAARLGEICARLDLFELNGDQVFFDHAGEMRRMTPRKFATWINNHVVMASKFDKATGHAIPGMLSSEAAGLVLDAENFRSGLRKLNGVNQVRCPVVRLGGALERLPWGYDEETGIYTVPGGLEFDENLPLADAKWRIHQVFNDFPFTDDRSMAVQIAAMLSLYVRYLPGGDGLRPGFLWYANKPGCGKSVCAMVALFVVMGHARVAKLKKDEHLDKEIEAFCRAGAPYIFFDNIRGGLSSTTIEQMLTSGESTGRSMGGHETFTAHNKAFLLATANLGLELTDDIARRFLIIDLFEKGNPEEREISYVLDEKLMRSPEWRKEMLEALHALVRHWHENGCVQGSKTMASFDAYARLMGGIVEAGGYAAPFEKFVLPDARSPGEQEFAELMMLLLAEMGEDKERQVSLPELAKLARAADLYQSEVGTLDDGKQLTVKLDGLGKDERGVAEDHGYLTPSQNSKFGNRMKKEIGSNKKVAGKLLEFGRRDQSRKSTWTVKVLE
jgi:hypothetical protein